MRAFVKWFDNTIYDATFITVCYYTFHSAIKHDQFAGKKKKNVAKPANIISP